MDGVWGRGVAAAPEICPSSRSCQSTTGTFFSSQHCLYAVPLPTKHNNPTAHLDQPFGNLSPQRRRGSIAVDQHQLPASLVPKLVYTHIAEGGLDISSAWEDVRRIGKGSGL